MIGVFVTFRYADNFDEQAVRKIAETARARFEGHARIAFKGLHVQFRKSVRPRISTSGTQRTQPKPFHRCASGAHNGSLRGTPQRRVRADCYASGERSSMNAAKVPVACTQEP